MDFVSFVLEETPKYECSETFDLKNLLRASQFAHPCSKIKQGRRLGWLKFGCKFSSKWLSFGCHSTPCDQRAMTDKKLSYTLSKVLATEPLITEIQARQKLI